jgi:hypothetical protein
MVASVHATACLVSAIFASRLLRLRASGAEGEGSAVPHVEAAKAAHVGAEEDMTLPNAKDGDAAAAADDDDPFIAITQPAHTS